MVSGAGLLAYQSLRTLLGLTFRAAKMSRSEAAMGITPPQVVLIQPAPAARVAVISRPPMIVPTWPEAELPVARGL